LTRRYLQSRGYADYYNRGKVAKGLQYLIPVADQHEHT
jgi:hypothetical protein